jgi:hypothetical protein
MEILHTWMKFCFLGLENWSILMKILYMLGWENCSLGLETCKNGYTLGPKNCILGLKMEISLPGWKSGFHGLVITS